MRSEEYIAEGEKYVAKTYARFSLVPVRGEDTRLWDADGKEYTDFVAGLAVVNLGHCHPKVVEAIREQAGRLIHTSNLFHIPPQIDLARRLVETSFADKAFFCNSGAEANEAAIKLARKYSHDKYGQGRGDIITMVDSFHGRTLATLAATGQEKFKKGFYPPSPGFVHVAFDDLGAAEAAVTDSTCAVLVEPIQGEGGVNVPREGYLAGLRRLCDERDLVLIFDEIQTGMGRTGKLFAYEHEGVEPDVMTLAKSLAGGTAVGAMVAKEPFVSALGPGTHASTFGGNFLAAAAGVAAMDVLAEGGLLENCRKMGSYFRSGLETLREGHPCVREVRGRGLLLGVELDHDGPGYVLQAMERGFLINCTMGNVLRFIPPLTITQKDIDALLAVLDEILPGPREGAKAGGP
ncbi:MAG: aspartate aminotransferase family protein [Nitrospinota bacterium]